MFNGYANDLLFSSSECIYLPPSMNTYIYYYDIIITKLEYDIYFNERADTVTLQ